MSESRATEEGVFDLRIGLDEIDISEEDCHFFDITGYLVLPDLLDADQIQRARAQADSLRHGDQEVVVNIISAGDVLEDAMALRPVLARVNAFIWGNQYRLIGSRTLFRKAGEASQLTAGGAADSRRYARYRCEGDGQFRCLMMTCLIALHDTTENDGAFCALPASHKANLPHPYADADLTQIAPLRTVSLRAGSGVLITESLSRAFAAGKQPKTWLAFHYGPSYMVDLPGCEVTEDLRTRIAADADKRHLLLAPYYHPAGSQGEG